MPNIDDGVPFDQEKYGYLTETDALDVECEDLVSAFETAKKNFLSSASEFQSADDRAHTIYKEDKEAGFTTDSFLAWVPQNYPLWPEALNKVQSYATQLKSLGFTVYREPYQQQVAQGGQKLLNEVRMAYGRITAGIVY